MDKEEIKAKRRALYQEAKKRRDEDPNYLAQKERARAMRKEQYQAHKNKLKEEKKKLRAAEVSSRDEEIAKAAGIFEQLRLLKFDQEKS